MMSNDNIECKPTHWFKIRVVLILLMFTFFALWFFKDGKWGYKDENTTYVVHRLFASEKGNEWEVNAQDEAKKRTAEEWVTYASKQTIPVPEDHSVLPEDYDFNAKWPEEIINGYEALKNNRPFDLWKKYTERLKLDKNPPEKIHDAGSIREQFIVGGICAALAIITAFIGLRTMKRQLSANDKSFTASNGAVIPYEQMHKLDLRKWDNKGLAILHYKDDSGAEKKTKIDGLVYGQFKEEDGKPAERLMELIKKHFKGEIIEYVDIDEEEDSEENETTEESNPDEDNTSKESEK